MGKPKIWRNLLFLAGWEAEHPGVVAGCVLISILVNSSGIARLVKFEFPTQTRKKNRLKEAEKSKNPKCGNQKNRSFVIKKP